MVFSSDALPFLGSLWLLVLAHVVLTLPYLLNVLLADMASLGLDEQERVGATLGASLVRSPCALVRAAIGESARALTITWASLLRLSKKNAAR